MKNVMQSLLYMALLVKFCTAQSFFFVFVLLENRVKRQMQNNTFQIKNFYSIHPNRKHL